MSHTSAGTAKNTSIMGATRGIPLHCEDRAKEKERRTKSPPYVKGDRIRHTTKSPPIRHDACFSPKKELLKQVQNLKDENLRLHNDNVSLQKEFRRLEDQIEEERIYYNPDCDTIKRENKRLQEEVTELTEVKNDYLQKIHTADRDICFKYYKIEKIEEQLLQERHDFHQLQDEDEGLRTECQLLEKQLKEAERIIATLVNRLKREKQNNEMSSTCKHDLEVELKQKTLEEEQLRQAIEKISVESEQLKSLYPLCMQTYSKIKKENDEMRAKLDDTQRYESLLKDANENIEVKHDQIRLMQQRLNTWETAIVQDDLASEVKRLTSENTFLQHSLDRERKENETEEEERNKDRQITTLQKLCENVSQELKDANRDTQELRDKNEILRQQIEQVKGEQETDMANINNNLQGVEKKNVDLQNPAIAELSDEKRPTKLAEIYSELYDNEWTDAFDEQTELFKGTEQKVIDVLLTILKFVHETCHEASTRYLEGMQIATSDASTRGGGDLLFEIGPGGNAPHQLNGILREIRQLASPFLLSKIKKRLSDQWNRTHIQIGHKTRAYIDKCLDLCWDMSVKDPPVVLMSLPVFGSDYNKDRYGFYTESGQKISYVVWPGMLLHEGGPILVKGVVQGKKT